MRILIAHDGSPRADATITDLIRAGMPPAAEAIVLCVADAWVAPSLPAEMAGSGADVLASQAIVETALARARDISAAAAAHVRTTFAGWKVTPEATAGSPSWEIIRRADEWKPDLVAVGATGRSALDRVIFGTVANLVVTHAHCSVRVARGLAGAAGPPRIIVAVDGSPGSQGAVDAVARRSWPAGSEARVVEAVEDLALDLRGGRDAEPSRMTTAACEALVRAGLAATPSLIAGDPKRVILEAAESWKADCVFVGARGLRAVGRFLLGSVSSSIASRATCSVEVVRE